MAKETVEAVRQAELNAAQKERDAFHKKETILSEAQQNAKSMVTSMTKEALIKAERNLALANQQGIERMEASKLNADNEVLLIKEMAHRKEEAAIKLVLSTAINYR